MKNWEDKIMMAFYGLFGAGLGFLIFAMPLGGAGYIFTKEPPEPWNGLGALIVCLGVGFGAGVFAYKRRDQEFGSGSSSLFQDEATAVLFSKRLLVIAGCLAALYFLWQTAKRL